MPANDDVLVRMDPAVRREAAAVPAEMGLTVSGLCRNTLARAAREKRLPFRLEIPNEETLAAFEAIEKREGLHYAKNAEDMFRQLGI